MNRVVQNLKELSGTPSKQTTQWLQGVEDAIEFLKENSRSDVLVLYASLSSVLIHSALAPLVNLELPNQAELSRDFLMTDDSWSIDHVSGGGDPDRVYLAPPMHHLGETMGSGEKLVFRRSFLGRGSTEISQKLVHALNLHFVRERSAFCRLDQNGDIEDVISIFEERPGDWESNVTIVTILAKDFADLYAAC